VRNLVSSDGSRVGEFNFNYAIGNSADQAPDRLGAGDGAEVVFHDQTGSDERVRGVFYQGPGYHTYVQSVSLINMFNDDRTEFIRRILEALYNPSVHAEPASMDFGVLAVNDSEERILTVSNQGDSDLTISDISVSGFGFSGDYAGGDVVLEPDSTYELTVTFHPTFTAQFTGWAVITSDDVYDPTLQIYLQGTGGNYPAIVVTPDTVDFGENVVFCGVNSPVTISNSGNDDLVISNVLITGDYFSSDFSDNVTIEPDSSHDLAVTFLPETAGEHAGTLTIVSNDPDDGEVDVHLMGSAIGGEISHVGSYDTPGTANDVYVLGDYAYVADGASGLCIIDVSNPAAPSPVGACDTDGWAHGVFVSGDYAYIGDWWNGLVVIDVSDPFNPVEVGHLDTPGNSRNLELIGNLVYLGDCTFGGFRTIDVSDPENPVELDFYDTPHRAWDVSVWDTLSFIGDRNTGLLVFNTSDPENFTLIGSYDTPCDAYRLDVVETHAYVADRDSGLCIIDVSDPTNPDRVGTCQTLGTVYCVDVVGDYAFMAIRDCGLCIVEVADPANPSPRDCFSSPGDASGVMVLGDYAYVADADSGLQIYDVSYYVEYPDISTVEDTLDFGDQVVGQDSADLTLTVDNNGTKNLYISHVSVSGYDCTIDFDNWVVIQPNNSHDFTVTFTPQEARSLTGVLSITSNDPDGNYSVRLIGAGVGTFTEIGSFDSPGSASHIVVDGNFGFIADGDSGLCVIDLSDPADPVGLGCYDTDGSANFVMLRGSFAYLADGDHGLVILDISDPVNISEVGSYDTPGNARALAICGDYAFVADGGSGLRIIDISDPTNPDETGFFDTTGDAVDVKVSDDLAFVADGDAGLRVINVSDPHNPREIGFIDPDDPISGVDLRGDYAYLANGLRIVDISDPDNPSQVGSYDTPQAAGGIVLGGDYAYVADNQGGLLIFDITDPTNPDSVGSFDTQGHAVGIAISGIDQQAFIADSDSGLCILDISDLQTNVLNPCPRKDYVMIGIPVAVPNGNPEELFGDDFDDTSPGSPYWRISRWDAANNKYIRYCETDPGGEIGDPADFAPGLGFWVSQWAVENCVIDIRESQFTGSVPQDQRFRVDIAAPQNDNRGLTMLANPYCYTYDWRTTYFDDGTTQLSVYEASETGWINGYAYTWDNEAGRYVVVNFHPDSTANYTLNPWQGFWLEQLDPGRDIDILFTPQGFEEQGGMPPRPAGMGDVESWALNLRVKTADGKFKDNRNKAGISSEAEDGYDFLDALEFNPMAAHYVQMYFYHPEWRVRAKKYTYDYRSVEFDGVKTWDFTVRTWKLPGEDLALSWPNIAGISDDYSFSLEDLDTGTEVENLRRVDSYSFTSGAGNLAERHFRLSVRSSRPGAVIHEYGLTAVYPNPFNDKLSISFNLPALQEIQLKVVDLQGREVAVVDRGRYAAGLHNVSWDAGSCASGLYYIRLEASDQVTIRKVALVK